MEEIKALFFDIDGTIVEFQSNRIRKEVGIFPGMELSQAVEP